MVTRRRRGRDARAADAPEPQAQAQQPEPLTTNGARQEFPRTRTALGDMLLQRNLISPAQLAEALLQQPASGKRIGTLLVELGALDERDLAHALADQLGLPFADLRDQIPEAYALTVIPENVARALVAIPLRANEDVIEIAVADPSNEVGTALAKTAQRPVQLVVAPAAEIKRAIDNTYRVLGSIERHVKAFEVSSARGARVETPLQQSVAEDAPVVNVVNLILTQAVRDRASDVHIEPQDERVRIRFRIDGALHDVLALPAPMAPAIVSRIKIMAGMNIVERRRSQDGQIATEIDGRPLDVRVATTATIWGEKCVLRLLDKSRPLYRLNDLGMPNDTHETFSRLVRSPFGMVICAGPTGSGKTTTLYATLSEINEPQRNIMTIEDPVEYIFPSINQIQTNEQAGMTFADGLKAILRQDPDVILVGEIRDVETARIAVQSALTGHFVMSSLHATDSAAALHRFLDMGIETFLVSSSVLAIVGQRLVRRICEFCKVKYQPTDEEMAFFAEASGGSNKKTFYQGEGCNFCAETGYQDRVGVYELLRMTPEIKRLVVGWATQEEIQRMAVQQGMRTLIQEAMQLVKDNVTTVSEVIRSIYATS